MNFAMNWGVTTGNVFIADGIASRMVMDTTKIAFDSSAAGSAAGAITGIPLFQMTPAAGSVFNIDRGGALDFRVVSGANNHMFFVDASADVVSIGSSSIETRVGQGFAITSSGGTDRGGMSINAYGPASTAGPLLDFNVSRNANPGSHTVIANGDALGTIIFRGDDGDEFSDGAFVQANVDGTPGNNDIPCRLIFGTSPDGTNGLAEHFRISENGDLTATDTSIGSNSDSRLKKDITDYTYNWDTFKTYAVKQFNWKQPIRHRNKTNQIGFIAQDLQSVDSNWVQEFQQTAEGVDGITNPEAQYLDADLISLTSKLGETDAMYVSIIQQLIAKVETLEAKVTVLEG